MDYLKIAEFVHAVKQSDLILFIYAKLILNMFIDVTVSVSISMHRTLLSLNSTESTLYGLFVRQAYKLSVNESLCPAKGQICPKF